MKTAVQWLFEEYKKREIATDEMVELSVNAEQMEKEQAIKFGKIVADKWGMIPVPLENIEDTYNETFKSE